MMTTLQTQQKTVRTPSPSRKTKQAVTTTQIPSHMVTPPSKTSNEVSSHVAISGRETSGTGSSPVRARSRLINSAYVWLVTPTYCWVCDQLKACYTKHVQKGLR